MKKQVMAVAVAGMMSWGVAGASSFDGIYAGVSLGSFSTEMSADVVFNGNNVVNEKGKSGSGSALGLLAGYGQSFDRFYVAGEFNYRSGMGDSTADVDMSGPGKFKNELGQSFSIAVLPGYLVRDDLLVYGRLSYGLTESDVKIVQGGNTVFDYGAALTTTGFGVGASYAVSEQLLVRGEVQTLSSSNAEFKTAQGTDTLAVKSEKISTTGFELSLLYRF
ncbi:outer membrane protein [Marinospirillum alkaliphilum]|uniref:Outer membrane protein beta-barrel domain-containing protein n=1 Tax=Marinospirillum alkaliphilum DSM 21637 TaxID=1122209 RepID=A0A1K1W5V4_9GAMM|nr:outer membrane beta-barrel protein [Marinospirillum alkaliphilum]SFX32750.1 Outer membrane protein beta-barrel domain-containing protein [Marinospirillum alkaliphilum DSM 21637]